jgi:hypothetical protein
MLARLHLALDVSAVLTFQGSTVGSFLEARLPSAGELSKFTLACTHATLLGNKG